MVSRRLIDMRAIVITRLLVVAATVVLSGCGATRAAFPVAVPPLGVGAESVSRDSMVLTGDARITTDSARGAQLAVSLRVRNTTDATIQVESATNNCEPELEFIDTESGRRFSWGHVAWRRRHEAVSPPLSDVTCVGEGLLVTIPSKGSAELGRQSYSVGMIRGDSIPGGVYRVRVPAVLYEGPRQQTVSAWSGAVSLPFVTARPDSARSRHVLKYTLIGTAIGAFVGAAAGGLAVSAGGSQGCAQVCQPNDEARYIIAGAVVGAGLGASVGFALGSRRAFIRLRPR